MISQYWFGNALTHWGRVTHICFGKIIIIGSDNGLSSDRHQAIIWTNAGLLSIEPLPTYLSENLIKIQPFSLKKMHVKMSSAKWRPSCLGLNVLTSWVNKHLSRPLFTKRRDVLSQDLVKSRSRKIGCCSDRVVRKFDRHLSSSASKPESRGFETSRDLAIRRPSA